MYVLLFKHRFYLIVIKYRKCCKEKKGRRKQNTAYNGSRQANYWESLWVFSFIHSLVLPTYISIICDHVIQDFEVISYFGASDSQFPSIDVVNLTQWFSTLIAH